MHGSPGIQFGSFVYDPAWMALERDGATTSLGGRAGALLEALLAARGEAVSKDALLESGWPGLTVEESNLAVQIAALRKALGKQAGGQAWIVTVPGVGYRLPLPAPVAPAAPQVRRPSLAVMPFQNLSGDVEQEYSPTAWSRTSSPRSAASGALRSCPEIRRSRTRDGRSTCARWAGSLFAGDLREAADCQLRALALSPNDFTAHGQLTCVSHIRLAEGAFEESLHWAGRSLAASPHYTPTYWMLAAANAHLGRMEAAREAADELLRLNPGLTVSCLRRAQHARDMARVEVVFSGLLLAGVPAD